MVRIRTLVLAAGLLVLPAAAFAQDHVHKDGTKHHQDAKKDVATPGQPMSEEEMMAAWQKAMTPGEHHKHMAPMVGKWNAVVKYWMAPDAPPAESKGVMTSTLDFGGRMLRGKFEGEAMGMPFTGESTMGYDNTEGKYWGTWFDSMSTGMQTSKGECSEDGKVFTLWATFTDPMTGQPKKQKQEIRVVDHSNHVFHAWDVAEDGSLTKVMEITYTRMGPGADQKKSDKAAPAAGH